MRRLTPLRSRRAVIAALQEDLREANGELWKAINREFDLQCENMFLRDIIAAYHRDDETVGSRQRGNTPVAS